MAGGIDWFRWHHGSVTDPKFQLVARKSKQALASVIAVWAFVLEQASASEERGAFGGIDCEAIDCLLGLDDGATTAILEAMGERGLVAGGAVSSWEKRQPKRERIDSGSTERSRAFRDRQRQVAAEGNEQRQETPETADATPRNATQRQETPRVEERREEETPHIPPAGGRRSRAAKSKLPEGFAVSERVRGWATERGYDRLNDHLDCFRRKASANGYTYADWDAAFMEAIREDWAKLRGKTANGSAPPPKVRGLVL